jgi:hypothetical protein
VNARVSSASLCTGKTGWQGYGEPTWSHVELLWSHISEPPPSTAWTPPPNTFGIWGHSRVCFAKDKGGGCEGRILVTCVVE